MAKIEYFYPSYTRKALTFTIDDGNLRYDRIFLDILKPVGIKGTFNLCSNINSASPDLLRSFYEGYEIANHVKYHPLVNLDGVEYDLSEEIFDEKKADPSKIYKVDGSDVFFWVIKPNGWRQMTWQNDYVRFTEEGKAELESIFGEGEVRDFVWPYGEQNNSFVKDAVMRTHRSARKTGCTLDTTGFALPSDRYAWTYNAYDMNLLEVMEKYEAYGDDGELKFFAFGVHSADFERDGKWDDLRAFADKYGNRPDDFWYAAVGEIFDYEDAVRALEINDNFIYNPSDLDVFVTIDGEKRVVAPHSQIKI